MTSSGPGSADRGKRSGRTKEDPVADGIGQFLTTDSQVPE